MRAVPEHYLRWFLYLVYALLLGFAAIAWFERMSSDAGYYLFHAINKKTFYIEHGRLVLLIAEFPALLITWLGLPLQWVVVAYSLGHVLFFAGISYASHCISGTLTAAFATALCAFMGLRESVFTPQFELYYGLALLILAFTMYRTYAHEWNPKRLFFLLLVLVFVITSHPMALLCTLGLFFLECIHEKKFSIKEMAVLLALIAVYYFWKKTTVSGYESGKFDMYWNGIKEGRFLIVFSNGNFGKQMLSLLRYYPDVMLLFVAAILLWTEGKRAWVASFYMDVVLAFLLLTWMLFPDATHVFRYLEQVYFPFVFIVICFIILYGRINYIIFGIAIFSLLYRGLVIYGAYDKFEAKTVLMDRFIDEAAKMKGQRFYVFAEDMGPAQFDLADWSYGFETMVRSQIRTGKTISIVTQDDLVFDNNEKLLQVDEYLFRRWEREKTSTLNAKYFKMDSGQYRYLFHDEPRAKF